MCLNSLLWELRERNIYQSGLLIVRTETDSALLYGEKILERQGGGVGELGLKIGQESSKQRPRC